MSGQVEQLFSQNATWICFDALLFSAAMSDPVAARKELEAAALTSKHDRGGKNST